MYTSTPCKIFVLSAQPRAGKTTLATLVESYGLAKVADISHSIHQKVFHYYKVPLEARDALRGELKEQPSELLGGYSFRQACINMGDFYGDRYQAEMVRDVHFAHPDKHILIPSLKNQFTLDYLRRLVDVPVIVIKIVRPGLANIPDSRTPLVADYTINNNRSKKHLYNQFKWINVNCY